MLTVILAFSAAVASGSVVSTVLTILLVGFSALVSRMFLLCSSVGAEHINGRFRSDIATSLFSGSSTEDVESSELSELDFILWR